MTNFFLEELRVIVDRGNVNAEYLGREGEMNGNYCANELLGQFQ